MTTPAALFEGLSTRDCNVLVRGGDKSIHGCCRSRHCNDNNNNILQTPGVCVIQTWIRKSLFNRAYLNSTALLLLLQLLEAGRSFEIRSLGWTIGMGDISLSPVSGLQCRDIACYEQFFSET